jgi:hypothetical protein
LGGRDLGNLPYGGWCFLADASFIGARRPGCLLRKSVGTTLDQPAICRRVVGIAGPNTWATAV